MSVQHLPFNSSALLNGGEKGEQIMVQKRFAEGFSINVTICNIPATLLAEFENLVVKPHYGKFNEAILDLMQKTITAEKLKINQQQIVTCQ